MNTYETVVVINAHQSEDTLEGVVNKIKTIITDNKGNILDINRWGKRRLAYEIKKRQHGYYISFIFEVEQKDFPSVLKRFFKFNEEILRYLVIGLNKKVLDIRLKKKRIETVNTEEDSEKNAKVEEKNTEKEKAVE